jgi:hypothetical protein
VVVACFKCSFSILRAVFHQYNETSGALILNAWCCESSCESCCLGELSHATRNSSRCVRVRLWDETRMDLGSPMRPTTQLYSLLVSLDKNCKTYQTQVRIRLNVHNEHLSALVPLSYIFDSILQLQPFLFAAFSAVFFPPPRLMLRLSFLSSRPALRKVYPNSRCLRSLHENATLQKKHDPTAPEDLTQEQRAQRRREQNLKVLPEHAIDALRVPEEFSHIFKKVRLKDQPDFLKPEVELPEAEVAPPKKRGRPRKQAEVKDDSVTAEGTVQVPKRTRRRKTIPKDSSGGVDADASVQEVPKRTRQRKAISKDISGGVDGDVEDPKKAIGRRQKDAEGNPDNGEPSVGVPSKTTPRSEPARPEQEYDENVNVEDAQRGRPRISPPSVEEIPEEEIANLPPLQKEVLQQLRMRWNRNRNRALGDVRRVNVIGEDLCGMIPSRLSYYP